MKTILALTDLSENSTHAAEYAYELALKIETDLLLCNAFLVPAMVPEGGMIAWPSEQYAILSDESACELDILKKHLEKRYHTASKASVFHPKIDVISETGNVCDVVKRIKTKADIQLIVAGTHRKTILSDILMGNTMNSLINDIGFPLLLVPQVVDFKPIKKIVFGSDLGIVKNDIGVLAQLIKIVAPMETEIILTHICTEQKDDNERIRDILRAIVAGFSYKHLSYKMIHESSAENGLHHFCENEKADMLVMIHHPHNLLQRIFTKSHSQKIARHISIPLLVMSGKF